MFDSALTIHAFMALLYFGDAVQITPYKYGPGLGHLHIAPSYGYGEDDITLQKPLGLRGHLAQPLGHGYGLGGAAGPLSHGYGADYKGEGLGYGYSQGLVHGRQLGHGFYPGAVGVGHGVGYAGYGPGILQPGLTTAHHGPVGHLGGSVIDQSSYSAAKNSLAGQQHSSSNGLHQATSDHGDAAFRSGQVAAKDVSGESVAFTDVDGAKNGQHEGKTYLGGRHFDKEGKHAGENVLNENHKKGHNVKSFKKSHHLDETGQTEEFYDEDHDEGGNYAFGGHAGKFGETSAHSFKGGFSDGKFSSGEHKKEGHFGNEYTVDKVDGEHGKFGGSKFARDEHAYGFDKGVGEHGLGGHHQTSGFYNKYPQFY